MSSVSDLIQHPKSAVKLEVSFQTDWVNCNERLGIEEEEEAEKEMVVL